MILLECNVVSEISQFSSQIYLISFLLNTNTNHFQSFTSIVGPNGSGKSNVIDSMLFVFGYRASKIRSKKISVLLHNSAQHQNIQSCTVAVHFKEIVDIVRLNVENLFILCLYFIVLHKQWYIGFSRGFKLFQCYTCCVFCLSWGIWKYLYDW